MKIKYWLLGALGVAVIVVGGLIGADLIPVDPFDKPDNATSTPYTLQRVTAPENNAFNMGMKNYQSEYADNISGGIKYKLGKKSIMFKPAGMSWDTLEFKTVKPVDKVALFGGDSEYQDTEYLEVFDKGIDLKIKESERKWQKIISIDSLKDLGVIPEADNLEIRFAIDTDFIIDGWNTASTTLDLSTTTPTRLGDMSYLQVASAWDSYSEEVCEGEICEILTNKTKLETYIEEIDGQKYYVKKIPVEWLKTAQYPIYTDADISYGTRQEFTDNDVSMFYSGSVCAIDDNIFVVVFKDNTDSSEIKAIVGKVSGNIVTFGNEISVSGNGVAGDEHNCVKIDANKFVVIWEDGVSDLQSKAATVSETTITLGNTVELSSNATQFSSVFQLDVDKFGVSFKDTTEADASAIVGTVSGTTITIGSIVDFDTDNVGNPIGATKLDTDKFVECWTKSSENGVCEVATVSGTTITVDGTEYLFNTGGIDQAGGQIRVNQLGTSKFLASYPDGNNLDKGNSIIGEEDGGAIIFGSQYVFSLNTVNDYSLGVTKINDSSFVTVYENRESGYYDSGTSVYSTFDNTTTTISHGSEEIWDNGYVFGTSVDLISVDKIVIVFVDDDSGDDGSVLIGYTPPASDETTWCPTYTDWTERRSITVNNATSSSNLVDFAVPVQLTEADASNIDYTKTQSAGQDIRFCNADNSTTLDYEIEEWDEAATSTVWVKIPHIMAATTTQKIWMYYNNSGASDAASSTAVWNEDYLSVWHLATSTDSTTYHSDAVPKNEVSMVTGITDGAQQYNGSTSYLDVPDDYDAVTQGTISFWYKPNTTSQYNDLFASSYYPDASNRDSIVIQQSNTNILNVAIYEAEVNRINWVSTQALTSGVWYYITVTMDALGSKFYINGSPAAGTYSVGTSATDYWFDDLPATQEVYINRLYFNGAYYSRNDGVMDEIRILNADKGDDWNAQQYECMEFHRANGCLTYGAEETAAAPPAVVGGGTSEIIWFMN